MLTVDATDQSVAAVARAVASQARAAAAARRLPRDAVLREALGVDHGGVVSRLYADEAIAACEARRQEAPADSANLHRLALMYHARAMEREAAQSPRANDDWRRALRLWLQLAGDDAFWQGIEETTCQGTDPRPVRELRARLPVLLAKVHYRLLVDPLTLSHRWAWHLRLPATAGISDDDRRQAQAEVYAEYVDHAGLPTSIWDRHASDAQQIRSGLEHIAAYLGRDPDCLPAMEDAARLHSRLLELVYDDFASRDEDDPRRLDVLADWTAEHREWRPLFDKLAARRESMSEHTRPALALWYRLMAEATVVTGDLPTGIELVDRAVKLAEGEALAVCQRLQATLWGYDAYHRAVRESAAHRTFAARAHCDRLRAAPGLHPGAAMQLAKAYAAIHDYAEAMEACRQGLELLADGALADAPEESRRLREDFEAYLPLLQDRQAGQGQPDLPEGFSHAP